MKNIHFIILFLLQMVALGVNAQKVQDFTYSHLGQAEGLSSQRIYSIRQTEDGAVWWSSKNGVERYNGVSVKRYQMGDLGMFSNFAGRITKLTQSKTSDLFAFDNKGGIFFYDKEQDKFQLHTNLSEQFEGDVIVNDVLMTEKGIWLAMREGVFFLQDKTLIPVIKNIYTNTIVETRNGILLCTRNGVMECHPDKNGIPRQDTKPHMILPHHVESGYYDLKYNKVWLGGFLNGLHILTPNADGTFTDSELLSEAIHNPVRSICPYDDNIMLVGVDGLGVYEVSRRPDATEKYESALLFDANEGKEGVLHGNGVYAVLRDSWGNIIIGSYSGGIDIARPVGSTPAMFQHIRDNLQSLQNDHVNCVAQFPDGTLVMGTDNGASLYQPSTKKWHHVCHGSVILCLCMSPTGTMLAGSYGKGVYEISPSGQVRQLYTKGNGVLRDDHVYKVYYDRQGHLWMGCLDGDLVQKTVSGNRYYPIKNVQDIVQLPNGKIAIGTASGIQEITPETGQVTELDYSINPDDVNKFVHTLYVNKGEELWIGTDGGGIYIYDLNTQKSIQVIKEHGLPSNTVCSITKDSLGRMMIATEQGLAFVAQETPTKVHCVNYCYGIEREYSVRAVVNMRNGHILYGTTSGALIINPKNVQEINYTAKLHVFGVDGQKLQLSYDERTFDLHYECINLRNQFDIVYQYKVGDGEWSQPTDQQYIRFTNLEPGSHELLLRSVSRTCGTILDEQQMFIIIGQPWWNSWWMRLFYLCLIGLAFYGAWHVYQLHAKYMRLVVSSLERETTESITVSKASEDLEYSERLEPSESSKDSESSEFIGKVTKLIVDHLSDSDFNIDQLCREMAMSRTLFYLRLKSYTGKSPQDFIRVIRLERAASLLRNGHPVTEAAVLSGFDNPKYFSTVFKKYFGVSPSKYC